MYKILTINTIEAEEEVTAEQEDILTELAQQCYDEADSCTVRRTGCDRWSGMYSIRSHILIYA